MISMRSSLEREKSCVGDIVGEVTEGDARDRRETAIRVRSPFCTISSYHNIFQKVRFMHLGSRAVEAPIFGSATRV